MGDEKQKRLRPRNKPYKKKGFDKNSFLKRSNKGLTHEEEAEEEYSDYLDGMDVKDEI